MIEWRPYNIRYEVSSCGRVRSLRTKRTIRQQTNDGGYRQVKLICDDGVRRWKKIHLLVLDLFVGPRPTALHHGAHAPVNDKRKNCVENLRWALPTENEADKKTHGTARNGRSVPMKPSQIVDIRERAARGESFTRIAKTHGVHRYSVARVVRGIRRAS